MALTTDQKSSKVFKKWIGVGETTTTRDFFEEPRTGRPSIFAQQVWQQSASIPIPAAEVPSIVELVTDLVLTAVSGTTRAFYHANLVDAIPFNFDPLGTYNYSLKDSLDNPIPFGSGDWVVDPEAGLLTFYGTVPANMPPKITFYRYIGTKGVGSGSGTYWKLDGSVDGNDATGHYNIHTDDPGFSQLTLWQHGSQTANIFEVLDGIGDPRIIFDAEGKLGWNVYSVNTHAILELSSQNKGVLIPRILTANRIAMVPPIPEGLTVYDTDLNCYFVYDGNAWVQM